jgi:hypothetical protein
MAADRLVFVLSEDEAIASDHLDRDDRHHRDPAGLFASPAECDAYVARIGRLAKFDRQETA